MKRGEGDLHPGLTKSRTSKTVCLGTVITPKSADWELQEPPSFRPSFRALTPLLDPLLALKEDLKEGVGALKDGLQEGGIRGFPSYDRT